MSSGFYRAFEDRHRGSRELILSRLEIYLPFIEQLKAWHTPCTALDLGCGRGEWLQLLQNNGVEARGVDLDEGMLQACHELNLQVELNDAITALEALPENSLSIVSGFHIVEHIEFSQVQALAEQAFRVLQPGGLLILETPNAENLVVGTNNFYLDPTHIRPVPNVLLSFVTEMAGFAHNKVLRLQEDKELLKAARPSILHVLSGVSPDYAVIAQKPADDGVMASFEPLFSTEYGISINYIADRYEQALQAELNDMKFSMEELAKQEQAIHATLIETKEITAVAGQQNQMLAAELHNAQLRTAQLDTLTEQLQQQISQITQHAHNEESRARQVETELREVSIRAAQLEAQYDLAQSHHQALAEQQTHLTKQWFEKNLHIQELKYELERREQQLTEVLDEIAWLKNQTTEKNQQINTQTAELEHALAATRSLEQQLADSVNHAHHWHQRANELEVQLNNSKQELHDVHGANHHHWAQLQERTQQLELASQHLSESLANAHHWHLRATSAEQRKNALLSSTSWRVTMPLRGMSRFIGWLSILPIRSIKALVRPFVKKLISYSVQRPNFHRLWAHRLRAYPLLYTHLRQFAINRKIIVLPRELPTAFIETSSFDEDADLVTLTPRAKKIYRDLQAAIERHKEQK